jgi:hypothetical protein
MYKNMQGLKRRRNLATYVVPRIFLWLRVLQKIFKEIFQHFQIIPSTQFTTVLQVFQPLITCWRHRAVFEPQKIFRKKKNFKKNIFRPHAKIIAWLYHVPSPRINVYIEKCFFQNSRQHLPERLRRANNRRQQIEITRLFIYKCNL